jgi:hypothetical protein
VSVIRTCESCGEEIDGTAHFGWDGLWYCSTEHMPMREPPPCGSMVIFALRLLCANAKSHKRDSITIDDITWAIQELER